MKTKTKKKEPTPLDKARYALIINLPASSQNLITEIDKIMLERKYPGLKI